MEARDVGVIGGGPAGAALATLLAARGYSVLLIDRAEFPRPRIGESLPPKIEVLLKILEVDEAVNAAGFTRMRGTTVSQGRGVLSHDFHPAGDRLGFQVDRALFDRLLLERARSAGVTVLEAAAFVGARFEGERIIGMVFSQAGVETAVQTRFLVDASGASGVLSRALGLKRRDAIRTVALSGYWKETKVPVHFPAGNTLFEMLADGWIWSVLRSDGLRNVTLGVDPSTVRAAPSSHVELYLEHMRASELVGPLVERARLVTPVEIHDATWSAAERYAGGDFLLVGDAASVIDPLTSQGVHKALQSGVTGAAVINTCFARPEDAETALDYYQQLQEATQQRYAEIALSFYRGSPHADQPFWKERMRSQALFEAGLLDARLVEEAERRRRFLDRIDAAGGDCVRVAKSRDLALEERPVAEGGFIVRRSALVSKEGGGRNDWIDIGVVDAALLFDLLDGRTVAEVFEAYAERTGEGRSSRLGRLLLTAVANLAASGLLDVE